MVIAQPFSSGWSNQVFRNNYKRNVTTITDEGLSAWYRFNAAGACASDGGTVGNTVSQLQLEYEAKVIAQDKIFYSALLGSVGQVTVEVDGGDLGANWTHTPIGNTGIYYGSVAFKGHSGGVEITITRDGGTIVGSERAGNSISVKLPSLVNKVCIQRWGKGNFAGLCGFACSLGYCPVGACVYSQMGAQMLVANGIKSYPKAGESASYSGVCSFACNYGNCMPGVCGTVEAPLTVPTVSPFTADTCTGGSGSGTLAGLCSYGCNNIPRAANTSITGLSTMGGDSGLCNFACTRSYCPSPTFVDNSELPGPACTESEVCDFSKSFSTLDALEAALNKLEPACTLTNFTGITSSYDNKFDEYVKYIEEVIPDQLDAFMRSEAPYGPGNQFFHCTYKFIGRNSTTSSCPGDIGIKSDTYIAYYELVDEEGFYSKLSTDYGINPSLVQFGKRKYDEICSPVMDETGCVAVHAEYIGYPVKAPTSDITATNPKDIMIKALPNIQNLTSIISVAKIDLALGSWFGSTDDLVQSLSMAVFMPSQAVTSMQAVVEVAESYEKTEKKKMISEILMGVLLVVPFLGELDLVADAFVGLSRIAR
ncbi:carbohydrate-binding module family 24 protein [Penicillium fimorum]|uniref:Carbohydrate-binding module family 24 protein n=1 Tax=Penicillium fimorum TaxID=1882269 RepID=A0A9X0C4F6_9EURO|nr:carbohydrate-binding module family 24 protein [Penicillium fimorum]